MDAAVIYLIFFCVVIMLIVSGLLLYRAVQVAKRKQALFEERFSKSYDRHTYRKSKLR